VNYDVFRLYWPDQAAHLIDDSGPALAGFPFSGAAATSSDVWTLWNIASALG
jgi:hypothetical protein